MIKRQADQVRLRDALHAADTVPADEELTQLAGETPAVVASPDGERGALCAVLLGEETPYGKREADFERAALSHADTAARAERLLGRPAALERARTLNNAWSAVYRGTGSRDAPAAPTHQHGPPVKSLRCGVDRRRAFTTTRHDGDPLYRSFVHWQGNIACRKRPMIFDVAQGAPCPEGERLTGGLADISEYVALRQEIIRDAGTNQLPSWLCDLFDLENLESVKARQGADQVFIVSMCEAQSLMPIYRQTRCIVGATVDIGVFVVLADHRQHEGGERRGKPWLAVCSESVALHMAHQGFTMATVESVPPPQSSGHTGDGDHGFRPLSFGGLATAPATAPKPKPMAKHPELLKLAKIKGHDLVHLHVRCVIEGQHRTVPIEDDDGHTSEHIKIDDEGADCQHAEAIIDQVCLGKEHILASPHAFSYFSCNEQVLSLAGDACIVALVDHYYFPLGDDGASGAWVAETRQAIADLSSGRGTTDKHLLRSLISELNSVKPEWRIAAHAEEGIVLPWAPELAVHVTFAQALVHAFLTVAPILRDEPVIRGQESMTDRDWDAVFQPRSRPPPSDHLDEQHGRLAVLMKARQAFLAWYPIRMLAVPSSETKDLLALLLCHVAVWGRAMCPQVRMLGLFSLCVHSCRILTWNLACKMFYAHRANMRRDLAKDRALVLWAHLREPTSAFAELPLELVSHIMSHLHDTSRSGKHDAPFLALTDRQFSLDIDLTFKAVACALHSYDTNSVLRLVLDIMPRLLLRYLQSFDSEPSTHWPESNVALVRRFCKITACALAPICPTFSALVWSSWIVRRPSAAEDVSNTAYVQDGPITAAASEEMGRWWRKHVSPTPHHLRHRLAVPKLRSKINMKRLPELYIRDVVQVRSTTGRGASEQSRLLRSLIARITATKGRIGAAVHVTVCRGLPAWAQQIIDVIAPLLVEEQDETHTAEQQQRPRGETELEAEAEAEDDDNEEAEDEGAVPQQDGEQHHRVQKAVRGFVLNDPVLRPYATHLLSMAAQFQERIVEGGLASVREVSFDEAAFVRRFAPYIARQTGAAIVEVTAVDGAAAAASIHAMLLSAGQQLFAPGIPLVVVVRRDQPDPRTKRYGKRVVRPPPAH